MSNPSSSSTSHITIGSFDGLHLGHQTIIHQLIEQAHQNGEKAILITFSPNPIVFFQKIQTPFYLTTNQEKVRLLKGMGVDQVEVLPFDSTLASTSAEIFIRQLYDRFHFSTIHVGYDFRFGNNREGNTEKLCLLGQKYGFSVHIQEPVKCGEKTISSSLIRKSVSEGKVAEVYAWLNRWYSLEGKVVHGDGRGKKIGIPTANISSAPQKLLPKYGIYAARIQFDDIIRPAAVSIGVRPTFYQAPVPETVEAYILDWEQDIYEKTVVLEFVQRLRDEIQYENAAALSKQIEKDIQATRKIIEHE